MSAKTAPEMRSSRLAIAFVGENRAQSLMRGGVTGIGLQRGFVMDARFRMAVGAEQEVGEIDARHRVIRMVQDRFRIDAAGGVGGAVGGKQRSEFVERAEMGRMPAQDRDERGLRLGPSIECAEQRRALDLTLQPHLVFAAPREQRIELGEPRFLRKARTPGRGGRYGLRASHGLFRCLCNARRHYR